jgi:glyoxylase-like metal-dependent hydrolase (beta-lactamase superfamily II)
MPETTLTQLTEHVYWMSPGKPDRPSLCAVIGANHTLMLDAAASDAHAQLFLNALRDAGVRLPRYVALTHWHWDHIFGAAELGLPLIAHHLTAEQIAIQAGYTWDDAALDARVAAGLEILMCANDIKVELPEPRNVRILLPDIVFDGTLDFDLGGGVSCHIRHVGGDHAHDACVMHVAPDGVLFLGDSLCEAIYTPQRYFTGEKLFPLLETVLSFDAHYFIEGHNDIVMTRVQMEALAAQMRLAGDLVARVGTDETAVLAAAAAETGGAPDEELTDLVRAFIVGQTR